MNDKKRPVLDSLAMEVFGRSYTQAQDAKSCVSCGATDLTFDDELSEREYKLSLLCQKCQNEMFADDGGDDEDEEG